MTWLVVIVGLVFLVFVHELGHFAMARALGVKPRSFYIGFPPALVKVKRKGIEYGIGAIPLGGMVRIPGMNRLAGHDLMTYVGPALHEDPALSGPVQKARRLLDEENYDAVQAIVPELRAEFDAAELTPTSRRASNRALRELDEATGPDAYWRQASWRRILIIAAGPAVNVLVALVLFFAVYSTGAPTGNASTKVGEVELGMPAARAGLLAGDRIVAVNGHAAATFDRISQLIRSSRGAPITVTVERNGRTTTLGPRRTVESGSRWIWGFVPATEERSYGPLTSAHYAARDAWEVVSGTIGAFASLAHGHEKGQLTTVVGIAQIQAQALKISFNWYLQILAFVSMSLALLNLLPLLPLDGGHILFTMIEAVRRRALAREVYERVSMVGLALILLVFFIALSNEHGGVPH
ncbi:MAG TPA: M50 family metallopeptidase [Gaiellaceae bacterium]|nr:M50 family metallopeptidase [Gaiellaceae bacterium]